MIGGPGAGGNARLGQLAHSRLAALAGIVLQCNVRRDSPGAYSWPAALPPPKKCSACRSKGRMPRGSQAFLGRCNLPLEGFQAVEAAQAFSRKASATEAAEAVKAPEAVEAPDATS